MMAAPEPVPMDTGKDKPPRPAADDTATPSKAPAQPPSSQGAPSSAGKQKDIKAFFAAKPAEKTPPAAETPAPPSEKEAPTPAAADKKPQNDTESNAATPKDSQQSVSGGIWAFSARRKSDGASSISSRADTSQHTPRLKQKHSSKLKQRSRDSPFAQALAGPSPKVFHHKSDDHDKHQHKSSKKERSHSRPEEDKHEEDKAHKLKKAKSHHKDDDDADAGKHHKPKKEKSKTDAPGIDTEDAKKPSSTKKGGPAEHSSAKPKPPSSKPPSSKPKPAAKSAKDGSKKSAGGEKRKRPVTGTPSGPSKPKTPFFRYCTEHRSQLRKSHPNSTLPELTKMLDERWTALSAELKQPYEDAYQADKKRYDAEVAKLAAKKQAKAGPAAKAEGDESSDSDFDEAPIMKRAKAGKSKKQRAITDMFGPSDGKKPVETKSKPLTPEELAKQEKAKQKLRWKLMSKEERQAEKEKAKEQKKLERERAKEEKRKENERLKEEKRKERQAQRERERELQLLEQEKHKPREDTTLTDSKPLPAGTPAPTRLPPELLSMTLQICEFCRTFNQALATDHLKTLTPEKLEQAILNKGEPTVLHYLACLLISLLEISDPPASARVPSPLGVDLCMLPVRAETATALLYFYLQAMEKTGDIPAEWKEARVLEFLHQYEFSALAPEMMLKIMSFLCDQHFYHAEVTNLVDSAHHRIPEIRKEQAKILREERQKQKELKAQEKEKDKDKPEGEGGSDGAAAIKAEPGDPEQLSADEKLALALAAEEGSLAERVRARSRRSARNETKEEDDEGKEHDDEEEPEGEMDLDEELVMQERILRCDCLGQDRTHASYFSFTCVKGVLVQPALSDTGAEGAWVVYDDENLPGLVEALNPRGLREHKLKESLEALLSEKGRYKYRVTPVESEALYDPETVGQEINQRSVESLRKDFETFYLQVCEGGFGCGRLDSIVQAMRTAATPAELAACLLEVEEKLDLRFLKPPLGRDNTRQADVESTQLEDWRTFVKQCSTPSEVSLIYELLHESIRWDKSCALIKCKICRKSSDDAQMLLCDKCDHGYHMRCLKPPLFEVPEGEWLCKSCQPVSFSGRTTRVQQRKTYCELSDSDDDFEDEDSSDEDSDDDSDDESADGFGPGQCQVCGTIGDTLNCVTCSRVYHPDCAGLRHRPRGDWKCPQCQMQPAGSSKRKAESRGSGKSAKRGRKSKKSSAANGRSSGKRKRTGAALDPDLEDATGKSVTFTSSSRDNQQHKDLQACTAILRQLTRHASSWPFLAPVNLKMYPDYSEYVDTPMDLETVREKLNELRYPDAASFASDVRLIFSNCKKYNADDSDAGEAGIALSEVFEALYGQLFASK